MQIKKPVEKNTLPVELFIGPRDKRMREGLCHDIALKPFRGGRKIAIIDDADFLSQESANALLKTLEEPPPRSVLILIGTSEQRQLMTIRSRSQIIRFSRLDADAVAKVLMEQSLVEDLTLIPELAASSNGSVEIAAKLADPEILTFRNNWLQQLATHDPPQQAFADSVNSFVDGGGKESATKRERMRFLADVASQFYRNVMNEIAGHSCVVDPGMRKAIDASISRESLTAEQASRCLDRCLETFYHIAANANQANIIECWLSELAQICRGEKVTQSSQ